MFFTELIVKIYIFFQGFEAPITSFINVTIINCRLVCLVCSTDVGKFIRGRELGKLIRPLRFYVDPESVTSVCYGTSSDHEHICVVVMAERNRPPTRESSVASPIYNIRSSDGRVVRPRCERVTQFLPMPQRLFSSKLSKTHSTQTEENFSCVKCGVDQRTERVVERNLQQNVEHGNVPNVEQNIEQRVEPINESIIENDHGQNNVRNDDLNTRSRIMLRDLPSTSSGIYTAESFACVTNEMQATSDDQVVPNDPVCFCIFDAYLYLSNDVCVFLIGRVDYR